MIPIRVAQKRKVSHVRTAIMYGTTDTGASERFREGVADGEDGSG
jgi:hypothetical protein